MKLGRVVALLVMVAGLFADVGGGSHADALRTLQPTSDDLLECLRTAAAGGYVDIVPGTPFRDDFSWRGGPGPTLFCGLAGDDVTGNLASNDQFLGGEGDDWVGYGNGSFSGGPGNDRSWFNIGSFNGGAGDDSVETNSGIFDGGDGNDHVDSNYSTFNGDNGDDYVLTNYGTFNGGAGNDYVVNDFGTFNQD